jgi:murein DD-endopeptidase MepM/ murein hydrolase activator NlpD
VCVRQRLSSEPDRYRGRRRVPTPPRSRYAAVVTTAVVGAGVVAISAGAGLTDAKTVNPSTVADLDTQAATQVAERSAQVERSSRDAARGGAATTVNQSAPDVWLLPLHNYRFTSPYGVRWGKLHAGVDMAAPEGTPYTAARAGTVKLASWYGGYGNAIIIDNGDGIETVYGHASRLLVKVGQKVQAGDVIGLVGNTGHSFGAHLHFEVHVDGVAKDPVPYLRARGMDIQLETDTLYSGSDQ